MLRSGASLDEIGEVLRHRSPNTTEIYALDVPFVGDFLDHLEKARGNGARSRNTRLAAIHSFFQYLSFQEPAYADQCRRILAIPSKRYERRLIEYLTPEEIDALLAAPDRTTWIGRRDRALLLVGVQTGLRVSELIGLRHCDMILGAGPHVCCEGKGRKQRFTPLRQEAVEVLTQWLRECPAEPATPAFPSSRGGPLSRDAVERLVAVHAERPVGPVLAALHDRLHQLGDAVGRHLGVRAQHDRDRVARNEADHQEDDHRDAEQHQGEVRDAQTQADRFGR
jgi:site-specific recombinase XerD